MTSKITVALTTFNGKVFLDRLLSSIFTQTYQDFKLLIVDDCSTDGTPDILSQLKKKHNNVDVFYNNENLGYIRNFEKALTLADSDFVALADQDDVWYPEKLEVLISNIGDASLICSDASLIDEKDRVINESFTKYSSNKIPKKTDFRRLVFRNYVTGCTTMLNRKLLKTALPFPGNHCPHDWWLAFAAYKSGGIKYLDIPLVKYRQHSQNSIGAKKKSTFLETLKKTLYRKSTPEKIKFLESQVLRVRALRESTLFNKSEEKILLEAEKIFKYMMKFNLHPEKYFLITKYLKYLL